MNDQHFFDLAMKVIVRQASDAERRELDTLLEHEPDLREEFARLKADVRVAKDMLPLMDATAAATGELPGYARARLQKKVRQTLGFAVPKKRLAHSLAWGWRWVLGLGAATAVVLFVVVPVFRPPNAPIIQLAMLDTTGGTRGTDTNELPLFQKTWTESPVLTFSSVSELEAWEKNWPNAGRRPAVKIIYDPASGEVRVSGSFKGKAFQRSFPLENGLAATLQQADSFVREQMQR